MNFTQQLKDFDISNREGNWSKFDNTFHTVVKSLELQNFVFDPVLPSPFSHSEIIRIYTTNDGVYYAEQIVPGMYHDVSGRILHRDPEFRGIEIIHEEEKRRFNSAIMLLYGP